MQYLIGLAKDDNLNKLNFYFKLTDKESEEKVNGIKSIYNKLNIEQLTIDEMQKYYNLALHEFEKIKIAETQKQNLLDFAKQLMDRES